MMARIRTIKPEFWRDESLSTISSEAALLAIGLLNHADDEGYFNANPKLVESDVFPLRELSSSTTALLQELHGIGYIEVFSGSDSKRYGRIVNFDKHQVINKKVQSKIKCLCELQEDYCSGVVALPSGKERKGNGKEVEKEKELREKFVPPIPESLLADWMVIRKSKKLGTVTETAWDGIVRESEKAGISPESAIKICCERGWGGFNADWISKGMSAQSMTQGQMKHHANVTAVTEWLSEGGII